MNFNANTMRDEDAISVVNNYNNNFFELTFNGDANELYIDVYNKIDKVTIHGN